MTRIHNPRRRILVEGQDLSRVMTDDAVSLSVEDHVDEADAASFEVTNRKNEWIDHPLFDRGNLVEVFLGYGSDPPKIFEGVIAVVEPHFPQDGVPTVSVTAYDRSYLMRKKGDKDAAYPDRTASEVARQVALSYRFREEDVVTPDETPLRRFFMQSAQDDWTFLQGIARELGFELYVELGTLHFRKPRTRPEFVPGTFVYRENLISFEPALTVDEAVSKVVVRGWDEINKRPFEVVVDDPFAKERDVLGGQAAGDFLSKGFGENTRILSEMVATSEAHAKEIALAYFQRKEFELITATGACVGEPEFKAKRLVRIGGVGEKFSGTYYLTRVTHRFDDGGYLCEFEAQRNAISRAALEETKGTEELATQGYGVGLEE